MNIASAICAAVLLLAGNAAAEDGGKVIQKTTISLGTATPGGGFPLYGNAFAEAMNEADPTLSIEPRNTKGSNENYWKKASWISRWSPANLPMRHSWESGGRQLI